MLRAGDRLGDYEIVAPIRRGGMATLYLGQRDGAAGLARQVAIKVVHPHLADDPKFVRMFVDEASLCARIDHPNVVRVEALREHAGVWYLVMEYVAGFALSQLLAALEARGERLEPALATAVAIAVADGLHAAHELRDEEGASLGVVHRDVSPQNVLLAESGHVKLIDFGIAKLATRAATASGSLRGKLRYMPPEQAWGRPVDRRADVYALGVVLWEMLTTRALFDAEGELELLEQVRHPQVVSARQYAPEVPAALDAVLLAMLAPDPAHRPASAREVRERLARAVPSAATPAPDRLAARVRDALGAPAQPAVVAASGAHDEATATVFEGAPRRAEATTAAERVLAPLPPPSRGVRRAWLVAPVLLVAAAVGGAALAHRAPPQRVVRASVPDAIAPVLPAPLVTPAMPEPPPRAPVSPPTEPPALATRHATHRATRHSRGYRYVDGLPVSREPF